MVAETSKHQITSSTNLFELTASKEALEKKAEKSGDQPNANSYERWMNGGYMQGSETKSPARAVMQTPFVKLAGEMIFPGIELGNE